MHLDFVIMVRIHFLIDVGDEQILPAILVKNSCFDAHAGASLAVRTVADASLQADFGELAVLVDEEEVRDGIVGDEEIGPTVTINISGDDAPGFTQDGSDSGLLADVGEGSVAAIVEGPAVGACIDNRKPERTFTTCSSTK